MTNRKTKLEKISSIEEQIAQLERQKKQLNQQHKEQERKDRTKRLCKRAGLLESILPDTLKLTDEQFKTFLEKTTGNEYGRRTLANIVAKAEATATQKHTETAQNGEQTTLQGAGSGGEQPS